MFLEEGMLMCRGSKHKTGARRCATSEEQRQKANARKRLRYAERTGKANHGDYGQGTIRVPEASGLEGRLVSGREGPDSAALHGHGHRNGDSSGILTVDGLAVTYVATHQPSSAMAEKHRAEGKSTPTMYEISPEHAGFFRDRMNQLKENNKYHASVYVYEEDEYKTMRMFITDDGEAGIALKEDGDIVSVFSSKRCRHKSPVYSMLATAVDQGGRKLDCFDTVLPKIYAQQGFVEVSRIQWDDQYKPEGWEYETYQQYNNGRPDVVFMEYKGMDGSVNP